MSLVRLVKLMTSTGVLLILAIPAGANAEIVDLKWTGGAFAHKSSVAPRKFLEVCGKLKAGESVAWQFTASVPVDFNIHYHVGNAVTYPAKRTDIAADAGKLAPETDQDYCWMWSNRAAQPIDIDLSLRQVSTGN
jgi:hypothetical protein